MPTITYRATANLPSEKHRIDIWYFVVLGIVFFGEILQAAVSLPTNLLLGFGTVLAWGLSSFIAINLFLTMFVWRQTHGVAITDNIKKMAITMSGVLIEILPFLSALPAATLSFIALGIIVWAEDQIHNQEVRRQQETVMATMQEFSRQRPAQ